MEYLVICLASLAVSGLTLFSGFGLGTVLTPVMAIFFPIETAVAVTAVVHFANNLFKLTLFGRQADWGVSLRFGLPALVASFAGAWVLVKVSGLEPLFAYSLFGGEFLVTPVKLLVGVLIVYFAFRELQGGKKNPIPPVGLPLGGVVSGFFGGLSGNQGAFRSAFLLGAGLGKETFIATGVVLACVVDVTRLGVYAGMAGSHLITDNAGLVVAASLEAPGQAPYPIFFLFSTSQERQTLAVVQQATLATGVFLLAGLSITVYLVAMQVLRPVRAARLAAEGLAAGRLDDRMDVVGTEDLAGLARSMNHMAEQLDKKITELQNLSLVQQRFVSDVSHELRTPLTTIRMAAEVLHAHRESFDAASGRSSDLLSAELDRFEELLTDLLEISRFDAGAAELSLDDIDLTVLAGEELAALQRLADDSGTEMTLDADGKCVAEVDGRRIRRILRNLITNAIEHGEGRPITVHVRGDAEAVAIAVRDHGVGFSAAEAGQVFSRFWRADPSRGRRVGGTGLGLSIALEDARLHGGWLTAWGRPGRGAQFRLTVPRKAGEPLHGSPWPAVPPEVKGVARAAIS